LTDGFKSRTVSPREHDFVPGAAKENLEHLTDARFIVDD
jgi:hypothetical protein